MSTQVITAGVTEEQQTMAAASLLFASSVFVCILPGLAASLASPLEYISADYEISFLTAWKFTYWVPAFFFFLFYCIVSFFFFLLILPLCYISFIIYFHFHTYLFFSVSLNTDPFFHYFTVPFFYGFIFSYFYYYPIYSCFSLSVFHLFTVTFH